jgi:hypothetical protein
MPCLDCRACKTRRYCQADPIGDLCPDCGWLLEPVGDLGEIVGRRVIATRWQLAPRRIPGGPAHPPGRVGEIIARRLKQARARTPAEPQRLPRLPRVRLAFVGRYRLYQPAGRKFALAGPARPRIGMSVV